MIQTMVNICNDFFTVAAFKLNIYYLRRLSTLEYIHIVKEFSGWTKSKDNAMDTKQEFGV